MNEFVSLVWSTKRINFLVLLQDLKAVFTPVTPAADMGFGDTLSIKE